MNLLKADKEDFQNSEWSSVIQPWVAHNREWGTFILWSQDHYVQFHKRSNNCGNQESTRAENTGGELRHQKHTPATLGLVRGVARAGQDLSARIKAAGLTTEAG